MREVIKGFRGLIRGWHHSLGVVTLSRIERVNRLEYNNSDRCIIGLSYKFLCLLRDSGLEEIEGVIGGVDNFIDSVGMFRVYLLDHIYRDIMLHVDDNGRGGCGYYIGLGDIGEVSYYFEDTITRVGSVEWCEELVKLDELLHYIDRVISGDIEGL